MPQGAHPGAGVLGGYRVPRRRHRDQPGPGRRRHHRPGPCDHPSLWEAGLARQPCPRLGGGAGPQGAGQPGPAAAAHPRHLDRIASIIERSELRARASLLADEHDARAVTRLVNRTVLALLGGVVGVLSVMLLGTQGGPPFTGDTSLFQFFGYFGLFCATVLILRVLVPVLRDGVS
jgi:hypothetical protein